MFGGQNKRCLRWGSAHMRHHIITRLTCCQQLCREILEARLMPTLYQVCMGDLDFCSVLSSALVHVWGHLCIVFMFCVSTAHSWQRDIRGTILTAIGVDYNKQVVPIVFAFVENENTKSWYWFLERVKIHIVAARPDVCLFSDRHAGLLAAIRQLHEGSRG